MLQSGHIECDALQHTVTLIACLGGAWQPFRQAVCQARPGSSRQGRHCRNGDQVAKWLARTICDQLAIPYFFIIFIVGTGAGQKLVS